MIKMDLSTRMLPGDWDAESDSASRSPRPEISEQDEHGSNSHVEGGYSHQLSDHDGYHGNVASSSQDAKPRPSVAPRMTSASSSSHPASPTRKPWIG